MSSLLIALLIVSQSKTTSGPISAIDAKNGVLTIGFGDGKKAVLLSDKSRVRIDGKDGSLNGASVGDKAQVVFDDDGVTPTTVFVSTERARLSRIAKRKADADAAKKAEEHNQLEQMEREAEIDRKRIAAIEEEEQRKRALDRTGDAPTKEYDKFTGVTTFTAGPWIVSKNPDLMFSVSLSISDNGKDNATFSLAYRGREWRYLEADRMYIFMVPSTRLSMRTERKFKVESKGGKLSELVKAHCEPEAIFQFGKSRSIECKLGNDQFAITDAQRQSIMNAYRAFRDMRTEVGFKMRHPDINKPSDKLLDD